MFNPKDHIPLGGLFTPLISVIIPIYKVEEYLRQCVDSVLGQSFKDIELILVDDGSPDQCPKICDEYVEKDSRVHVIHKENGGLSDARNTGIRYATGKYLMFLDSDDYWDGNNCLENIVAKLETPKCIDVLVHGCKDYWVNKGIQVKSRSGYNSKIIENSDATAVLKYFFQSGLFPGSAWITVTNRKFILENELYFIKGIKSEDVDWLLNVFLHAQSFDSLDDTFYIYRKNREGSITNRADEQSFLDMLFIIEKWYGLIQDRKYDLIREFVLDYLAYQFSICLILLSRIKNPLKREMKVRAKKMSFLLLHATGLKTTTVRYIYRLFGLDATIVVTGLYHHLKSC